MGASRRQLRVWVVVVVMSLVVLLHYASVLRPFERAANRVILPIQTMVYGWFQSTPEEGSDPAHWSRSELENRYGQLQEQNESLVVENAGMRTLVEEAGLLEEQLRFLQESSYTGVTAKVSSRSSEGLSRTVRLNRGTSHGVNVGAPVVTDNGILVGIIRTAESGYAEVELLTSFNARVSAVVQNDSNSPGIVRGDHNLSLRMEFIPQFEEITVGQTVVTSGVDTTIPFGLVIGEVQEVRTEQGSLFQGATVRPLYQVEDLLVLTVLTS